MYTKGADSVIKDRLSSKVPKKELDALDVHLDDYSRVVSKNQIFLLKKFPVGWKNNNR